MNFLFSVCFFTTFILNPGQSIDTTHGSDDKQSACNAGDVGLIRGSGRSLGEGNGNSLQFSCLENSIDRGAWQTTYSPWGLKESDTTEQLTFSLSFKINKSRINKRISFLVVINTKIVNMAITRKWDQVIGLRGLRGNFYFICLYSSVLLKSLLMCSHYIFKVFIEIKIHSTVCRSCV